MSSNSENTDKKLRVMSTNNDAEKLKSHGKQNFEDEANNKQLDVKKKLDKSNWIVTIKAELLC